MEVNPFDPEISKSIATYASELRTKTGTISTPITVQTSVDDTAGTFHEIAAAMRDHNRRKLNVAIKDSQRAYARMKRVCSLE